MVHTSLGRLGSAAKQQSRVSVVGSGPLSLLHSRQLDFVQSSSLGVSWLFFSNGASPSDPDRPLVECRACSSPSCASAGRAWAKREGLATATQRAGRSSRSDGHRRTSEDDRHVYSRTTRQSTNALTSRTSLDAGERTKSVQNEGGHFLYRPRLARVQGWGKRQRPVGVSVVCPIVCRCGLGSHFIGVLGFDGRRRTLLASAPPPPAAAGANTRRQQEVNQPRTERGEDEVAASTARAPPDVTPAWRTEPRGGRPCAHSHALSLSSTLRCHSAQIRTRAGRPRLFPSRRCRPPVSPRCTRLGRPTFRASRPHASASSDQGRTHTQEHSQQTNAKSTER